MILADYMTNGARAAHDLEWWNLQGLAPRWLAPRVRRHRLRHRDRGRRRTGTHVGVGIGIGFGTGMLLAIVIGLGALHGPSCMGSLEPRR